MALAAERTEIPTILYVEDDEVIRKMVTLMITTKYKDISVVVAENGKEGLELFRQRKPDIVLTDLPLPAVRQVSRSKFLLFRSVLVPQCRLSLAEVVDTAQRVNDGLASLAAARGLQFTHLQSEWYGVDPIHIRPSLWRPAWQQILGCDVSGQPAPGTWLEGMRLYAMRAEREWLFGVERVSPQAGVALARGGKVWLF
jgi:CheY-like chemotaxis protein